MRKETIVSSNIESQVISINNEPHLKLYFKGISLTNYSGININYKKSKMVEIIIPLWAVPYTMQKQRNSIGKWEQSQLDFIKKVKLSYNTEIKIEEK